ncbi:TauD/TfdA family dioxygenase [Burkholderia glumae]|uniref:TauD/TfdA family dioxygenase n=1 Tax=Burkholderia glumae TaxID=337 RepID=UPI000C2772D2|nr:TauD/TfdA family dioxygenase [Burkholderia glumae]PJO23251.1 branched-chain amino acid aminotransferase [Burkholderia glumae AU6208]QHE09279.1 branched-chain amino acid aminotransferase [Burkholderia glumae AU6208]
MPDTLDIDLNDAALLLDTARAELDRQGWTVLPPQAFGAGVRETLARFGTIVPQYNGQDTWEVRVKPGFEKVPYSQSRNGIGPHTEVPVGAPPPRYLALHCHRQARCGQGHTRLADGVAFCRSLPPELQRFVSEVPVTFAATLVPGTRSRQTLTVPIMSRDGERPVFRFSYNQFLYGDVNPSEDALERAPSGEGADTPLARLAKLAQAYFEADAVPVLIPDGHLLIWDNHRLIHARSTFTDPERHLTRYWLQTAH